MNVVLKADKEIPDDEVQAARARIEKLERYMRQPPPGGVRLTLRKRNSGRDLAKRPYVADADMRLDGRVLAAHADGPTAADAAEEVAQRLRRQIRDVVGAEVAQRNEPERGPHEQPPPRRAVRGSSSAVPQSTRDAVHALLDGDLDFYLFRHELTGEDVVVYRRDDGRTGLIHPRGSGLAEDADSAYVLAEPSRYPGPIKAEDARAEIEERGYRFLYFVDVEDGRGRVLYRRDDRDYGLVEPA
jgi:ribosome-associated translation inhibitor RaiA